MSFRLENISKSFGAVKALDRISFSTREGEIFGLIGPDGAGKTTLFRILVTLLLADEGSASVAGLDVKNDYRAIRRQVGYMAGRFSLYQDLTVRENLQFYATVFGTTIRKHYDLIKPVYEHIEPFEKRLARNLSGGMKQKLALCCALIHRPGFLVLDEPTTGVDAVSRKEFWDLLEGIRSEGITILVSTPYMDEASLCDTVGLMQKSRLLSVGNPASMQLKKHTRLYLFRTTGTVYHYLEKIRRVSPMIAAWLFGDEIHVFSEGEQAAAELNAAVSSWQVPGLEWREIEPGVEDVFMHLMSERKSD
ncbi:MAG: ABC transporter ATP-binding protein [Bacteroidales bacterium]|nr:ABC transporter ATP-binding protein [Bacteroidales bacterium]